ncbi:MAG: hypothetical protein FD161_1387 [Limisphaerales bacterium]|nr:MAG: hypothetical protein FD161_1387 [Limisphaerales bacterium]KAG0509464.1 MAG: hypothetical protein E1N63_1306 [Limisphaerales bacterium]TXT52301.1 MAG: hypothetical protein FD140_788 [Limisphaerales bacterium]
MKTSEIVVTKSHHCLVNLALCAFLLGGISYCPALEWFYGAPGSSNRVHFGVRAGGYQLHAAVGGEVTHTIVGTNGATNFTFLCAHEYLSGKGSSNSFSLTAVQKATNVFHTVEAFESAGAGAWRTATNLESDHYMDKIVAFGITGWLNPRLVSAHMEGQESYVDYEPGDGTHDWLGGGTSNMRLESHGIDEGFLIYNKQFVQYEYWNTSPEFTSGSYPALFERYDWGTNFPSTWNYTNVWTGNIITNTNGSPLVITNTKSELVRMPYIARIEAITNFSTFTTGSYYGYEPQIQTNSGDYFRVPVGARDISSGTRDIVTQDDWPFLSTNLFQTFADPSHGPNGVADPTFSRPDERQVAWYGTNADLLNSQGIIETRLALPVLGTGYQYTGTNGSPGTNWTLVGYVDTFEVKEATPSLSDYLAAAGQSAIGDPTDSTEAAKITGFCFQVAAKLGTWLERKEIWKENP